jgi:23S rRNA pseudouridine1911/1915/1917 synthase
MNRAEATEKGRLDRLMQTQMPGESRSRISAHIAAGRVLVNGEAARKPGHSLRAGDAVEWEPMAEAPAPTWEPYQIDLPVLFEDEHMIVVSKPRGLPTHPAPGLSGPTLVHALLGQGTSLSEGATPWRPGIVHRLDRETTGLIMAAKTAAAHRGLAEQIAAKTAERRYAAVAVRKPDHTAFTVDLPLGKDPKRPMQRAVIATGKPARTHFKVLGSCDGGWAMAARLETGRTHQIRVHLAAMKLWVMGDHLYAPVEHRAAPLQLHAAYLRFAHPISGADMELYSPPPEDFLGSVHCSEEVFAEWSRQPNQP